MKEKNGLALINRYRTSLMGVAALLIFVFHEWTAVFGNIPVVGPLEDFIRRTGFCGVDVFFMLSGMGLTYSIEKSSLMKFYGKRIKRIILPFLIAGIIAAILRQWTLVTFIKNITGFNFYTVDIYSFLWFVPAIVTFYLLFPLYYKLFSLSKNKLLFTMGVIAVWLLISMPMGDVTRYDIYGFTNRIPIFVWGIYLGYLSKEESFEIGISGWIALAAAFLVGIRLSYQTNIEGGYLLVPVSNCCVPNFILASSGTLLMAGVMEGLSHIKFVGTAVKAFLSFFGTITFELYCIQELLGIKLREMFPVLGPKKMNLLVFVSAVAIAYLLHLFVKYFFKLTDKIFTHKTKSKE